MSEKLPLSVVIISNNEEENLPLILESIEDIAGEIVIVDSFSTDNTINIAKSYGALIFQEEFKGYAKQKQFAMDKASKEWILSIDSDEQATDELKQEIRKAINSGEYNGYVINRKTYYLGKLLKYAWQPDYNLRLVKKSANPRWIGENVHESLEVDGSTGTLKGCLIHYSYKSLRHHFLKTVQYAELTAESYHIRGKKFKLLKLLLNPIVSWIKLYIARQGFRDGMRGMIAAFSAFVYTFLKYAFLWKIESGIEDKKSK